MADTADVVIIGGGSTGTSIAFNLAKQGVKKIILVERQFLASGGTGKSGAIIRQHYSNELTARIALRSLRVFQNWAEVVGGDAGYKASGAFFCAAPHDRAGLEANVALQQGVGIKTSVITPQEFKEMVPEVFVDDLAAIAYEPESGHADPMDTVTGFANAAKRMGAEIRQRTEVTGIEMDNDQVTGVVTNQGTISTRTVVNAAGPWAPRIAGMVGTSLPIETSRHEICVFRRPEDFGPYFPFVGDFPNQVYMRPDVGGLTLVGSIDPQAPLVEPDKCPEGVDMDVIVKFSERACRRFPALEMAVSKGGWSGVYDTTPDWHPILGEAPGVRGMVLAVGLSGHGFKEAPALGEMVANSITGRIDPELDIHAFRYTRFEENDPIKAKYTYSIIG